MLIEGVAAALKDALLLLGVSLYVLNQKPHNGIRSVLWFLAEVMGLPKEAKPTERAMANMVALIQT